MFRYFLRGAGLNTATYMRQTESINRHGSHSKRWKQSGLHQQTLHIQRAKSDEQMISDEHWHTPVWVAVQSRPSTRSCIALPVACGSLPALNLLKNAYISKQVVGAHCTHCTFQHLTSSSCVYCATLISVPFVGLISLFPLFSFLFFFSFFLFFSFFFLFFFCLFFFFCVFFFFFFQAEDGIRDVRTWLEFRRVLFRSVLSELMLLSFFSRMAVSSSRLATYRLISTDFLFTGPATAGWVHTLSSLENLLITWEY